MYSIRPNLLIGFHGCDETVRNDVVNGKRQLNPSTNDYDWLGHGIYFWENNAQRALDFANNLHKNPQKGRPVITKPSVLGAVFTLGNCLDLLDSVYLDLLKESHKTLQIAANTSGIILPKNKNAKGSTDLLLRYLDCSVIEHFCRQSETKFDSIRSVFVEGKALYPTSGFREKNHIQIAIRNVNCIKGYFIPRNLDPSENRV